MDTTTCPECGFDFPFDRTYCSHCGRPQRFPNVEVARRTEERDALEVRYRNAREAAISRGCISVFDQFEHAVENDSRAVMCCTLEKLEPLISNHHDLYETYHQLQDLRSRASTPRPGDPDWDRIRPMIETALFGERNKQQVHYASLSLTSTGSPYYGECAILLQELMIAHRTSAFEKNSVVFGNEHRDQLWQNPPVPLGYRSTWEERGKLAVAKLADRLTDAIQPDEFPQILLNPSPDWPDDEFVELHVFGPLTLRGFAKVTVCKATRHREQLRRKVLQERLKSAAIEYAEIP